ncbi:MAG: Gfo/Idh/MocA family oxidoreductase [Roseicyclus sp.]
MTASHINWGILGAAGFARKQTAPSIHRARRCRLDALATRDPVKAAPFQAIAPDLRLFDDYDTLLADPDIHAVYIPLPNAMHVDWSVRAAEAGKAVLCEKPIALHASEFDRLIAARDRAGVLIAEAWMPAHHPQWQMVRDMIAAGDLGDLHTVTGVFTYGLHDPSNIRLNADLGGGALRDIGVYPIGAFRFATGLEPDLTWADAVIEEGVDTSTWVQARAGDVRFNFHVAMRTRKYQRMVFEGTRATLSVVAPFNAGGYGQADLVVERDGEGTRIIPFPEVDQYALQAEAVAAALIDGTPFPHALETSRGTQSFMDSVFDHLEARN